MKTHQISRAGHGRGQSRAMLGQRCVREKFLSDEAGKIKTVYLHYFSALACAKPHHHRSFLYGYQSQAIR